jgi:hypothetical protein
MVPQKPLGQSQPNFAEMILGWPSFKIVSVSAVFYPRWPPSKGRTAGHIFGREPSNDYFIKILFLLGKWFQTRRFIWEFPIQSQPNFVEMILGWSPFKFVSVRAVLYAKWPPLLTIEISSNGQNVQLWRPSWSVF